GIGLGILSCVTRGGLAASPCHRVSNLRLLLALAVVLDAHSGGVCQTVVVIGLAVATADRRHYLLRADLRLGGADSRVVALAGVLGAEVTRRLAVFVRLAGVVGALRHLAGAFGLDVHSRRRGEAVVAVGLAVATTDRLVDERADVRLVLALALALAVAHGLGAVLLAALFALRVGRAALGGHGRRSGRGIGHPLGSVQARHLHTVCAGVVLLQPGEVRGFRSLRPPEPSPPHTPNDQEWNDPDQRLATESLHRSPPTSSGTFPRRPPPFGAPGERMSGRSRSKPTALQPLRQARTRCRSEYAGQTSCRITPKGLEESASMRTSSIRRFSGRHCSSRSVHTANQRP